MEQPNQKQIMNMFAEMMNNVKREPPALCIVCDKPSSKICSGCKIIKYCSKECQLQNWPQHKSFCKQSNLESNQQEIKPFQNPLLEWAKAHAIAYNKDELNKIFSSEDQWPNQINDLRHRLIRCGFDIPDCSNCETCINNINRRLPMLWARGVIATSLLSEEILDEIIKFSNGYIYERGCGTGYNAWLLKQKNAKVFAVDAGDENEFALRFYDIVTDSEVPLFINSIIAKDGALLYIWPTNDEDQVPFHGYDDWEILGGTKVIVIGDHNPDHCKISLGNYTKENAPPICPIFPPARCQALQDSPGAWKLVKEMKAPVYSWDINDVVQFWERTL